MIRLELRCAPRSGRTDLAWLAGLTGSLDEICDFLLRTEIASQLEPARALPDDDLAQVVNGQAVGLGSPIVHIRDGSTIIELAAQLVDNTIPVQVLAWVALLFKTGPEAAAWPGHVKKAWYQARTEAEQARQAYMRIMAGSTVEVVEDVESSPEPADQPPPARGSGRRGRRGSADLPTAVRASPPLGD